MPGRQPAGTTPPPPPIPAATAPADVIALAGRRGGHLRAVEEAPMTGATPTPAQDGSERLAVAIQSLFVKRRMSLADPGTAAAYDVALEAMTLIIVDTAYREGRLGEGEYRMLRSFLDAARLAPGHLTGDHNQ
jgi:hypothetical protein